VNRADRLQLCGGRGLNPTCAAFTRPVSRVWASSTECLSHPGCLIHCWPRDLGRSMQFSLSVRSSTFIMYGGAGVRSILRTAHIRGGKPVDRLQLCRVPDGQGCLSGLACGCAGQSSGRLRWGIRRGSSGGPNFTPHFRASTHLWASWGWCMKFCVDLASIGTFVEGAPAATKSLQTPVFKGETQD
jgi:hypothetical protein